MDHGDGRQISEAELAAFADGSLPPTRRAHVAARIERSSELRVLVGEQRTALEAVRALDAPAPARLCARLRPEPSRLPTPPHARLRPVPFTGARRSSDELLELAAWHGSRDSARIHNGLLPPLAPAIHRPVA
jgi:anti-sigma factor RsiW